MSADHDAAGLGLDPHHVAGLAEGQPQALPLADGELLDALMAPDHRAVGGDDFAGGVGLAKTPADEPGVVLAGHEADFLAVALRRHAEPEPLGHAADFLLAVIAHGEQQPREQRRLDAEEDVGLILGRVCPQQSEISS